MYMDDNNNILTEANYLVFCAKHYDINNKFFSDTEFQEDLAKVKYVKRLLNKYNESGELRERLILNHVIVLNNVFGPFCTPRMLFLKLPGYESVLAPFLDHISVLPDIVVVGIPRKMIITKDIKQDSFIKEKLKQL
jgi:hypothetical protein